MTCAVDLLQSSRSGDWEKERHFCRNRKIVAEVLEQGETPRRTLQMLNTLQELSNMDDTQTEAIASAWEEVRTMLQLAIEMSAVARSNGDRPKVCMLHGGLSTTPYLNYVSLDLNNALDTIGERHVMPCTVTHRIIGARPYRLSVDEIRTLWTGSLSTTPILYGGVAHGISFQASKRTNKSNPTFRWTIPLWNRFPLNSSVTLQALYVLCFDEQSDADKNNKCSTEWHNAHEVTTSNAAFLFKSKAIPSSGASLLPHQHLGIAKRACLFAEPNYRRKILHLGLVIPIHSNSGVVWDILNDVVNDTDHENSNTADAARAAQCAVECCLKDSKLVCSTFPADLEVSSILEFNLVRGNTYRSGRLSGEGRDRQLKTLLGQLKLRCSSQVLARSLKSDCETLMRSPIIGVLSGVAIVERRSSATKTSESKDSSKGEPGCTIIEYAVCSATTICHGNRTNNASSKYR